MTHDAGSWPPYQDYWIWPALIKTVKFPGLIFVISRHRRKNIDLPFNMYSSIPVQKHAMGQMDKLIQETLSIRFYLLGKKTHRRLVFREINACKEKSENV